jgi:transposase
MLNASHQTRIFLHVPPTDLRKGFDRLAALVEQELRQDPLSGDWFVFRNRRADRVKLLYWMGDGYAIWYKRLEQGTFRFPGVVAGENSLTISATDWAMLLDGVDLSSVRRGKRYRRSA